MFVRRAKTVATAVAIITAAAFTASCTNSAQGPDHGNDPAPAAAAAKVDASPDVAYLKKLGWEPMDNSLTNLACTDDSYAKAVNSGITLGIYTAAPYEYIDNDTKKPAGLDWDINMAVLKYLGITKYKTVTLQWDGMIPALNSGRIDVITGNIHQTDDRLKNMAFTSPAWWYGSSLMVPKGNPGNITTWKDLTRDGVKVGVVNGSQSQEYLRGIGADIVSYQDANSEFASLVAGREDVIVDDSPKEAAYIQANPGSGLTILHTPDVPPATLLANYARYGVRKSDCTLNAAYSRALSELRGHGVVTKILKKYGLTENMFEPQYKP
ncbi:MAG TPA: transporter substrate-binding domain-containing protein [Nocardioidaceae bacterium]|nr:transporter substrate-binding domain-containing protein [Nocardioidaceae bacterium]